MIYLKKLKSSTEVLINLVRDFLIPENNEVKKLMSINEGDMKMLLPNSKVNQKDVIVLFDYKNEIVRLLVKLIKYKNNRNLRKRIASYIYEEILEFLREEALIFEKELILIPMPMSPLEKRKKGFNQCEEICSDVKKISGDTLLTSNKILLKIKETARQTILGREMRMINIKNSMQATIDLSNKIVFVVDDVYTTGSTMRECRRALSLKNPKRVVNIFIAH